jgi:hypothetical protein
MANVAIMLQGEMPGGEKRFACVDPSARYTSPQVCQFRFSASLAPYASEEVARAALEAAGAVAVVVR